MTRSDSYSSRDHHQYRVIQSLAFTTAPGRKFVDTFDGFRKKRDISSYAVADAVSGKEADEGFVLATSLRGRGNVDSSSSSGTTWSLQSSGVGTNRCGLALRVPKRCAQFHATPLFLGIFRDTKSFNTLRPGVSGSMITRRRPRF
jgi:hypothetical protein